MSNLCRYSPDPLFNDKDLVQKSFDWFEESTLLDILEFMELDGSAPIRIYIGTSEINRADWASFHPSVNDQVTIKTDVAGDAIVPIILTLAVVAFAPLAAPALAAAMSTALGVTVSTAVATGIITMAGGLLINLLFAPSAPEVDSGAASSPTYNLSGIQNKARVDQPFPVVIGKTLIVPDIGMKPFSQYRGDDNYLYMTLNFGFSVDGTFSDIKIGDNPIDSFSDIEYQFSPGDTGIIDITPGNVDTVSGGSIERPPDPNPDPPIPPSYTSANYGLDQPVTKTTSTGTVAIELDFEAILYHTNSKGKIRAKSMYMDIEYRPASGGTWLAFLDTGKNVELRNGATKALHRTYRREVTEDQYEVRVLRTSNDENNDRDSSIVNWTSMRSFQKDTADYTGQKRFGMVVRASGQLNGVVDNLSAIFSAACEVWNGSAWVLQETTNPAWWFRFMALGRYNPNDGLLEFGGGITDSDMDIEGIKEWAQYCDDNNLTIGYVFDTRMVLADSLSIIARCGRAGLSFTTGKLGIVVDAADLPISQTFGLPDIIPDTFNIGWISESQADRVSVEFNNEDEGYTLDVIKATVPGTISPINPATVRIPGMVNKQQAGEEALLIAAAQFYRREIVTFESDFTGLTVGMGDVIAVSHPLPGWGQSGRLSHDGPQSVSSITLATEVSFNAGAGGPYWIRVRHPDGTKDLVEVNYSATQTDTLSLVTSLSQDPSAYPNNDAQDATWQFDASTDPGQRIKIIAIEPIAPDGSRIRITGNIDDPDYYDSINGLADYDSAFTTFNQGVATLSNLTVREELVGGTAEGGINVYITWDAENASGARISVKTHLASDDTEDDLQWVDYGDQEGRSFTLVLPEPATITVRLTAIPLYSARMSSNTISGTFFIQGITKDDTVIPILPRVTGLELQNTDAASGNQNEYFGRDAKFVWNQVDGTSREEIGEETYDIGIDYGSMQSEVFRDYQVIILDGDDGRVRRTEFTVDNHYVYTSEKNKEDSELIGDFSSQAERDFTIQVSQRGRQNQISAPASMTVNNPPPDVPGGLSFLAHYDFVSIQMQSPSDTDYAGIIVWMSKTQGFTPQGTEIGDGGNVAYSGTNNAVMIDGLQSSTDYYFIVAGYDVFGRDPTQLNLSSEFKKTTLSKASGAEVNTYTFEDIVFTPNDPGTDQISWTAGNAILNDGETSTIYPVAAGSATWTSGIMYIYWGSTDNVLTATTTAGETVATGNRTLAVYQGGYNLEGANGGAFFAGDKVIAGTMLGNRLIFGSMDGDRVSANTLTGNLMAATDIITLTAQIGDAVVDTANINVAAITTLLLDGQAVNIPVSSFNRNRVYSNGGWVTCVSAVVEGTGNPKSIIVSSHIGASKRKGNRYGHTQMRLLRNGSVVNDYGIVHTNTNNRHNLSFTTFITNIVDNLSTGTYRYQLQMRQTGNAGPSSADTSAMTIIETNDNGSYSRLCSI